MTIKDFFSYHNLFQFNTAYVSPQEKLFLIGGGVAILIAIVAKIAAVLAPSPVDKKFRSKIYRAFLFLGLSEVIWYFLRSQNVQFFGTLFMNLLLISIFLIWSGFIATSFFKNYKKEKVEWEKEQLKAKYLQK